MIFPVYKENPYMIINYIAIVSPQQLSASLSDAAAFSFQILEPLCVKRCAVGIAASGIFLGEKRGNSCG
jgi:hypothetical protein